MTPHTDRFEIARTQYGRALSKLREAVDLDETELIRDAMIQRFEFTFELAWKCMFYWLREEGEMVPEMVNPVLQAAFRCGLITDVAIWLKTKDSRNATSHTYKEEMAIEIASFVRLQAMPAFAALEDRLETL